MESVEGLLASADAYRGWLEHHLVDRHRADRERPAPESEQTRFERRLASHGADRPKAHPSGPDCVAEVVRQGELHEAPAALVTLDDAVHRGWPSTSKLTSKAVPAGAR